MAWRYAKHYTREEARALLPLVRNWLTELAEFRRELNAREAKIRDLLASGQDLGGPIVDRWVSMIARVKDLIHEFESREIQIKDVERGLVDFPAFIGGNEVFLCWEKSEEDIEFWHDLESGYSGRTPFD